MRTAVLRFLGEKWYAAVLFVLTAAMIVFLLAIGLLPHARQNSTSTHEPPGPMEPSQKNFRTGAVCDPAREVRGLWIPSVLNITYPSKPGLSSDELKAELDALLESARSMNLNTLCLQVRPASDALYHSALFPTSAYLSGKQGEAADGDFDALAYLCEIAAQAEPPVAVYAWVNPLRVTSAGQDPGELSPDNPAVLHPDWTVSYNGALYYNAAIPGVRDLIAAGVKEICDNYPVAGVIFDDYFYPYPVNGQNGSLLPFDDVMAYQAMGGGMTLDDFRRNNVNQMVKACYDAVHESSLTMRFGIAPFGIWQNNDGKNGGSDTAGMSSYSAIYCDPLAWMEGGYVDFIAPQLYWTFATSVARYDTLVRWWNAQCDRTGTDLWIAHATYRYDIWNTPGEMRNQIAFARSEISYRGSLFYGYPGLRDNTLGITDEIRAMFEDNIFYYSGDKEPADCAPLVITTPGNNSRCDDDGVFLLGQSDPASPVTLDGVPLSRTRNGYFAVYKTLHPGENTFVFRQGDADTVFTLWNGQYPPGTEAVSAEEPEDSETALLPLAVKSVSPAADVPTAVHGKETVTLSVSAEEGCNVSVETPWDHRIYTLIPDAGKPTVDGTAVYSVDVTLPEAEPCTLLSLGTPVYTVSRSSDHAELTFPGGPVYAVGDGAKIPVEVTKDDTDLKTARNSWYYDDYAPAMKGMRVNAERISDGYAELQFVHTAYLDASCIRVLENEVLPVSASIGKIFMERSEDGRNYLIHIPTDSPVPANCIKDGMTFTILLYQSQSDEMGFAMPENPLFSSVRVENRERRCAVVFQLRSRDNFYGFDVINSPDEILVTVRAPLPLDRDAERPLDGRVIVLDAGHGGEDSGALSPGSNIGLSEKDCNLNIVLAAEKEFSSLGAEVILLRDEDITVDIYDRMDKINALCPDLVLSIHQNSMPSSTDITHIRGTVGLYWTESGRSLADCVAASVSAALGRPQRETASQRLAMVRNYKFPSALIEIGFLTSPEEFEALTSPGGVERTAKAIVSGVLDWYDTQKP